MDRIFFIVIFFFSFNSKADYLFSERQFEPSKIWVTNNGKPIEDFKHLLRQLIKSGTGKKLLELANSKAKEQGHTFYDLLKVGNGSLTDTTLIRRFSPHDPNQITYKTESFVYLNRNLSQLDALLDLAHELTHFVYRKNFNPYLVNFTLDEFISNTIEGQGGEAKAFLTECKVLFELYPSMKSKRHNCNDIVSSKSGALSFDLAVAKFYQLGNYYDNFVSMMKKKNLLHSFPKISDDKASFISSAYGIPYPVAAFEEYLSVLNKVCENDKRRIAYLKADSGRSPASFSALEESYSKRCEQTFSM